VSKDPTSKKGHSRRRVLQVGGAVVASGALAAGGFVLHDRWLRERDPLRVIPDHRVRLPAAAPRMVIARGTDVTRNVRGAVDRMGGIGSFVTPDDVVVIKPNIGWNRAPGQAANTHPEVVVELVRACRAAKARRVIVSDCPTSRSRVAFLRSGILRAALEAGAEVLAPEDSRYHTVRISERLGTPSPSSPR